MNTTLFANAVSSVGMSVDGSANGGSLRRLAPLTRVTDFGVTSVNRFHQINRKLDFFHWKVDNSMDHAHSDRLLAEGSPLRRG